MRSSSPCTTSVGAATAPRRRRRRARAPPRAGRDGPRVGTGSRSRAATSSPIRPAARPPGGQRVAVRDRGPQALVEPACPRAGAMKSRGAVVGRRAQAPAGGGGAQHERAHALGMAQGELLGDHAAEREAVDVGGAPRRRRRAARRRRRPVARSASRARRRPRRPRGATSTPKCSSRSGSVRSVAAADSPAPARSRTGAGLARPARLVAAPSRRAAGTYLISLRAASVRELGHVAREVRLGLGHLRDPRRVRALGRALLEVGVRAHRLLVGVEEALPELTARPRGPARSARGCARPLSSVCCLVSLFPVAMGPLLSPR